MDDKARATAQSEARQRLRRTGGRGRRRSRRSVREQALFLFFLLLFAVASMWLDRGSEARYAGLVEPVGSGWTATDGSTVDLAALPTGSHDLAKDITRLVSTDRSLCFKSVDTVFDVYADGRLIYSYRPEFARRLGASYGMYVHTIAIPGGTHTLGLRIDPVFPTTPAALDDVSIEDGGQYMTTLFRGNLLAFGYSTLIVIVGLVFLSVAIFWRLVANSSGLDFLSLGMLFILIGIVGLNDTLLLQVLTRHPAFVRVISYVCLMLLPYPAIAFFASATGRGYSRLATASLVVCLANFGFQVFMTHRGISDYFYLVSVSHVIILLSFVVCAYMLVRAIREKAISEELIRCLLIGLSAVVVGGVVDVLLYHSSQSFGSTSCSRIGVMIFAVLISLFLVREQNRSIKLKQQEDSVFVNELTTAFARLIDMKDRYTNGHSFRVAQYTAMLARELGCDDDTVEKYYRIALLHDVGKIAIPREVLNKPGALTDEEFEQIKSHTTKGYDALKDISVMPELATGAQSHHERPDGRGYPSHLKGSEIPRVAQIIAVADAFDAMYSNRPYRSRMNFEVVVSIIRGASGTQLTPDVVDAFLRLVARGEFRARDDDGGGCTTEIDNAGR